MRKHNRTYHPRRQLIDGYRCRAHPIYLVWAAMMSRCYNPAAPHYKNYGGRGIKVDSSWHHFRHFAKDMGIRPGDDWTIERKDNNAGYCKSNCVWATRSDQCINRRLLVTNTSGAVGVVKIGNRQWEARFDYLGIRYRLGRYVTKDEAVDARMRFVMLFSRDRKRALSFLVPKDQVVWNTAKTKHRGVCPHADGRGYIVRCTIGGVRHYVGYFRSIKEGVYARSRFIEAQTRRIRVRTDKGQCG